MTKTCFGYAPVLSFSKEQADILDGSMLGDGNLNIPKRGINARFMVRRKATDREYLLWEYERFRNFCASPPKDKSTIDNRTKKTYHSSCFWTRHTDIFTQQYRRWYPNDKKAIPRDLQLTPLILLIWFLDDGCVNRSKTNRLDMKLSTDCFALDDVEWVSSLLCDRYHSCFRVNKNGNGYVIQSADTGTRDFISEIKDIIPACMSRKVKWDDSNFTSERFRSHIDNPAIRVEWLYNTIARYASDAVFATSDIRDAILPYMKEEDQEDASNRTMYHLRKLVKQGYLSMIDRGRKTTKSFTITPPGYDFFRSQTQ